MIAKAGKPVARLVPVTERPARRVPGSAKGRVGISTDFNEPLPPGPVLAEPCRCIPAGKAYRCRNQHGLPVSPFLRVPGSGVRDELALLSAEIGKMLDRLEEYKEKDYLTAGHAERLKEMCLKMGEKLWLSPRQMADLALLAQVHDLGKVAVPDSILFKKGPLTEEEWEVMRQHPEKGYRIALSSPALAGVADLILKHHERWDGKGYPLGLRGEEIPVECRILSIADAFDAMTGGRPYLKPRSKEEAVAELKKCAGSHFDPHLVDVFVSLSHLI